MHCIHAHPMQTIRPAELHLLDVTRERSVYQGALKKAKSLMVSYFTKDGTFSTQPPASRRAANKTPTSAHYSFNMVQQVFYPNVPFQPGPMYLTPRKSVIFGVCCEATPQQINYVINIAVDMGKGSNAIVSMLHYFAHHGLGEEEVHVHLHADNCGGQNKNAIMVQYLLWRVTTGQHKQITFSFMIPGHTKFSSDWCFGRFKKYRRTNVGGLTDLVRVVNKSASEQPSGLKDGSVTVTTYDWQEYFKSFCTKIKGMKKLLLRFESAHPGYIFVKERAGSIEVKRSILKVMSWSPKADQLPPVLPLPPSGLSNQRQWYLYSMIREFCPENLKDVVSSASCST